MKPPILKIMLSFIIVIAVLVTASPSRAAVEARASLSNAEVTIGQPFDLIVMVSGEPGIRILPPETGEITDPLEVRDIRLQEEENGGGLVGKAKSLLKKEQTSPEAVSGPLHYIITMVAWDTGEIEVPAIKLHYLRGDGSEDTVSTNSLTLNVKSVLLQAEPEKNPRDIKDVTSAPFPFLTAALALLIAAAAVAAVYFLLRWLEKRAAQKVEQAPAPPPRPAHELAYERLSWIESEDFLGRGLMKEYYYHISACLREYLENRYEFPALESTTSEVLRYLGNIDISHDLKDELRNIMGECDDVKFAKAQPPLSKAAELVPRLREIIRKTKLETVLPGILTGEAAGDDSVQEITV